MKKLVITLLLVGGLFLSSNAQIVIKPGIGFNHTHFSNDPDTYESTGRIGWQIGGTVAFGDDFYLEPGIFWMKNNWELKQATAANVTKFNNDISSVKVPLFVGWNMIGDADDDKNFHVFAGPAATIITETNLDSNTPTLDELNTFLIGANLGAGVSINKFFLDVGYQWGLNSIYKDEDVKTKTLWVNAGFRLTFL